MAKTVTLTYQDKILLHLLRYVGMEERYQVVKEVTQEEIAKCVMIQRKHLPRTLKGMADKELIIEKQAHVKGVKQIRRVYFLTWKGEVLANKLREDLYATKVTYKRGKQSLKSSVAEVVNLLGINHTLVEIIEAIDDNGNLDLEAMDTHKEESREPVDIATYEKKLEIYRESLENAWIDGKITINERIILDYLRKELGIPLKDSVSIEAEAIKKVPLIAEERMNIYRTAMAVALRNLEISEDEANMLEALRENMRITMIEHDDLMKDLLKDTKLIKDTPPSGKAEKK
jgi:DNA-binding HxlR family transcriptional regulator